MVSVNGLVAKRFDRRLRSLALGASGQGPDAEGGIPKHGTHCEEVPVSLTTTTGVMDSVPAIRWGSVFFIYIF